MPMITPLTRHLKQNAPKFFKTIALKRAARFNARINDLLYEQSQEKDELRKQQYEARIDLLKRELEQYKMSD